MAKRSHQFWAKAGALQALANLSKKELLRRPFVALVGRRALRGQREEPDADASTSCGKCM